MSVRPTVRTSGRALIGEVMHQVPLKVTFVDLDDRQGPWAYQSNVRVKIVA